MKLFLLVPALVSGFIYCHFCKSEYYRLHRYQGQYLNLRSTAYGFFFLLGEALAFLLLHKHLPDEISFCSVTISLALTPYLETLVAPISKENPIETIFVLQAAVAVPLLAFAFAFFNNFRHARGYGGAKPLELTLRYNSSSEPIDRLVADAFIDRNSLLFSLSSGKVYVGDIARIPAPNESEKQNNEVLIAPVMSGYRSDKNKIKFNTDYDRTKLPSNLKDLNFIVAIKKSDITSVSLFDFELYEHLKKKKPKT